MKKFTLLALLIYITNCYSQYSSDICNGGTPSSSSAYSGSYTAQYAFDNYWTSSNCWASSVAPTVASPQWLMYNFGNGNTKRITKYTIRARLYTSDWNRCPKDWTFEGSNDNISWTILDTRTAETGWNTSSNPPEKRIYTFTNNDYYQYYRINITGYGGGTSPAYVSIGEMEMMSPVEDTYTDYISKRSNIWYFGNNAGMSFNTEPPIALLDGQLVAREGCSAICDTAGNLLFYTNGSRVWNKNHVIMENGDSLMYIPIGEPAHATQSGVIAPHPGNPNQYYIFSVPCMWTSPSSDRYFRYALVDMTYNGGVGKVIQKKVKIGNYNATERITAVFHANQHDLWVINHEDNSNLFRAYKITSNGLDTVNFVSSNIGATSTGNCNMGCLKASPDGKKLAMAFWCNAAGAHFELYDFDPATGIISNLNNLGYPTGLSYTTAYGVEFSPDGNKLYGTTHMALKIYQWNLLAGSNTDISNSRTLIGSASKYVGALQLAPNGKIYAALSTDGVTGFERIGAITNPNALGTASAYNDNGFYLEGKLSRQGFPNYIQSFLYTPPFTANNLCFGDTTLFTLATTNNIDSVLWNFDDPSSGSENSSTLISPGHVFTAPGTYSVNVILYYSNSTTDTSTSSVTITSSPVVNLGNDTSFCSSVSLTLDAANAGATYLWNDNSTDQTLNVSSSGTYYVAVTNEYGCIGADTIQLSISPELTVNIGNDTTICGSAPITLDAGNTGASYLWNDNSTLQTLTVSSGGTYSVTVENIDGCTGIDSIIINYNPMPNASITPGSTSICDGNAISLTATGGDSFLWSTGETTASISVNPSVTTSYTVTVTNSCGSSTDVSTITVNAALATISATLGEICSGDQTDLTADGGTSFLWSTGETTQTITVNPLVTTTYYVTVSGNGCNDSISAIVTVKPNVIAVASPASVCTGDSVMITVSGGTSYIWSTSETTQTIYVSPASSTMYHVTVDAAGCTDTADVFVTVNSLPVVNLGADDTICTGSSIIIDASTANSSYLWNDNTTNPTITVTQAGNYSVTITDQNGCENSDTISITISPALSVFLGNDTAVCAGSPLTLNAGNPGSDFLWNDNTLNQTLDVTTEGSYSVTVTNNEGCTGSDTIQVGIYSVPVVNLGNDTSICAGQNIILNAGNTGAAFTWNNNSHNQTLTVNASGIYSVTVTNNNNCTESDSITLTLNSIPVVNLGNDTIICEGNNVILNAENPGAEYLWSTNETSQTITINTTGIYTLTVTDANNCESSDMIQISVSPAPVVNFGNDMSICEGASIILDAENTGASFTWNDNSHNQTLTVSGAGTYSVTVVSANNCTGSDTISIAINPLPIPALGSDTTICEGASIVLTPGLFTGYLWSDNSSNSELTVNTSGAFSVTVSDANTCENADTIIISVSTLPVINLGNDTSVCPGTALLLSPGGTGYTYLWSDNSTLATLNIQNPGTYSVTASNTDNCSVSDMIIVGNHPAPVVMLGNDTAICEGSTIMLHAGNQGSTYLWNNNSTNEQLSVTTNGIYSVTVTNSFNCYNSDSISISVNSLPAVNFNGPLTAQCVSETSYTLSGGLPSGGTYSGNGVSGSNFNASVAGTGGSPHIITYTYTDTYGCTNYDTTTIIVNSLPAANAGNDTSICNGQNIILNASGGNTYLWSNGMANGASYIPASTQTLTVTVTDVNNCSSADQITITLTPSPVVNAGANQNICGNQSAQLNGQASNSTTILWSGGSGTFSNSGIETPVYSPGNADILTGFAQLIIIANSACGVTVSDTVVIFFRTNPSISAGPDDTLIAGGSVTLNASGGNTYLWYPEDYLSCTNCQSPEASPHQSTFYIVTGTNSYGCSASDSVFIFVTSENNIFVPSAFSPNGDFENDILYVRGKGVQILEFMVFSRWGEMVFKSTSLGEGWDGTFKGETMNPGVFVYYLSVTFYNGERLEKKGNITLIK